MNYKKIASLVKTVQAGNKDAFGLLYELTYPHLLKITSKYFRNISDAEDVVQFAFVDALVTINQLKDPQAFIGWMTKIIFNKSRKYYKRTSNEILVGKYVEVCDDEKKIPDYLFENMETNEELLEMINNLSEPQKKTMLYYYYDGLKIKKIAELMECSENTVKSRMKYARKTIMDKILENLEKDNLIDKF